MMREAKNEALRAKEMDARKETLASLWQTAVTLALTFAVGALLPLLAAAFIKGVQGEVGGGDSGSEHGIT